MKVHMAFEWCAQLHRLVVKPLNERRGVCVERLRKHRDGTVMGAAPSFSFREL